QRGKIRGTYKLDGDKLTLTGTNEMYIDDGYKKDTSTVPFATVLIVGNDRLTIAGQEKETMKMVFRREGSPRLKPPSRPQEKPSSSVALGIFKKLKVNYAAYRTYADDGTFKSTGKAFRAKDAVFRTRFNRDGRFLFRVEQ